LTYESVGVYHANYAYTSDGRGHAYQGGTRASNIPLAAGLITTGAIARVHARGHFGHALAYATSQNLLRRAPVDGADGKVIAATGTPSFDISTSSTTRNSVSQTTAARTFTVERGLPLAPGYPVACYALTSGVKNGNIIFGSVASYDSSTGALLVTPAHASDCVGSGTHASWAIELARARFGYVWPAHSADASTMYGDPTDASGANVGVAMGSWWGIPASVDAPALAATLGLTDMGVELLYTLQHYGMMLTAVGLGHLLYAEPDVYSEYPNELADLTADWVKLFPHIRRLVSSNNPPGVSWAHPTPPSDELDFVLGGGTRTVPTAPVFVDGR